MPVTETHLQSYGEVADNPILLEKSVTEPIVEGLGIACQLHGPVFAIPKASFRG